MFVPDLSSVAREAAERAADERYPELLLAPENEQRADDYVAGFTECASRLPSEREVAEAARAGSAEYLREDIPEDGLSEDQHIARAVYALIGEKISGGAEASR